MLSGVTIPGGKSSEKLCSFVLNTEMPSLDSLYDSLLYCVSEFLCVCLRFVPTQKSGILRLSALYGLWGGAGGSRECLEK